MRRDMMPHFDLYQPDSVASALELAGRLGEDAWYLGGGQDSFDWLKNRTKRAGAVIELAGIAELKGIREQDGGLFIGAATTLTEITAHAMVRERFGLLAQAAARVASPQIRNAGTLGGNLCQDTRCWYYRAGVDCYRAGGIACYADTPQGQNREHAIFGASRCVAVQPSDTANALVALDAVFHLRGPGGERQVPASDFFVGPDVDIRRMTCLRQGEMLVGVAIPSHWAGAEFHFEKITDRQTWDFALVSLSAALRVDGGRITGARLVCGAVQCVPRRLLEVEQAVIGSPRDAATADRVAALASQGARPLNFNHFKIPLMENLVRRAIRGA
ncbi:MAG: hypothetical protein RL026_1989 [Pseudomonadota bacterium]|jgi:xanthine dehydrogenase YagS FAD-binding subunit